MSYPAATHLFPVAQREVAIDAATRRAKPGRGEESPNGDKVPALPASLVRELKTHHRPSGVVNALACLGSRQALGVQIFDDDGIVLAHEGCGELVEVVLALVRNPLMLAGDQPAHLLPLLAGSQTAREALL